MVSPPPDALPTALTSTRSEAPRAINARPPNETYAIAATTAAAAKVETNSKAGLDGRPF